MKKVLILSLFLTSIPTFATCSLDGEACSIAQFEQKPMIQTYAPKSGIKEFSGSPEARLNPTKVNAPESSLRTFRQEKTDYSYNSSCQFGICNQTGTPQLFEQGDKR